MIPAVDAVRPTLTQVRDLDGTPIEFVESCSQIFGFVACNGSAVLG